MPATRIAQTAAIPPQRTGHTTLVIGDAVHACAAAVIAVNLAHIDPTRPRIAYAFNVSDETRDILRRGWQLVEPEFDLGSTPALARKAHLLTVDLERAIYWDVDHLPLRSERTQRELDKLWRLHPERDMMAPAESFQAGGWCFNSGLMVYRPRPSHFDAYVAVLDGRTPRRPACWDGTDQGVLNTLFASNEQKWMIGEKKNLHNTFAVQTPQGGDACVGNLTLALERGAHLSLEELEARVDSYHFFGRAPPWGADCGACVLRGRSCNSAQTHRRRGWQFADACGFRAAQSAWYEAFLRLPSQTRGVCYERVLDVATLETAGRAKKQAGGRSGEAGWSKGAGCGLGLPAEALRS